MRKHSASLSSSCLPNFHSLITQPGRFLLFCLPLKTHLPPVPIPHCELQMFPAGRAPDSDAHSTLSRGPRCCWAALINRARVSLTGLQACRGGMDLDEQETNTQKMNKGQQDTRDGPRQPCNELQASKKSTGSSVANIYRII